MVNPLLTSDIKPGHKHWTLWSSNLSALVFHFNLISLLAVSVELFIPSFQDSDGDKSDDLVVDVSNEVRPHLSRAARPHSTPCTNQTWLRGRLDTFPCHKVYCNIGCVTSLCLLAILLLLFMQKVRQRAQREAWVTGEWKVYVCVTEDRSTHGYIYLCLHMRPQFVWPTCTRRWLSSALFAQSRSLTLCVRLV